MIKLDKPNIDVNAVIEECLSNARKQPTLTNIRSSKRTIVAKSGEYDKLAEKGKLGTLSTHHIVVGGATKDDMVWLYDKKFVEDRGRKYYDKIKAIPKFSRCPFCGVGIVSTLDHYLPKAEYPTYAVTPNNLVASCYDCNKKKKSAILTDRESELLHPYYDDFDDEIWLRVEVIFCNDMVFNFFVDKPAGWSEEKYKRAKNHFEQLELNALYVSHCGEEFAGYKYTARRLYETGGKELVKQDLNERILERRTIIKNNWRAAMYEGLYNCPDFFDKYLNEESI